MLPDETTAAGRQQLEAAISVVRSVSETDPVRRAARVRALLADVPAGVEWATTALAQAGLRERAAEKFGVLAEQLLFTPDGLEQSSRVEVADHRAARFAPVATGPVVDGPVLDLCCGIGADALALQRAGLTVLAVDRDPQTARYARANLASGGTGVPAAVAIANAESVAWKRAPAVFIDPARRTGRGRTFDPSAFSPSLSFVLEVLAGSEFAAAKLAPGLDHELVPPGVEAEWVSFGGGVKEAVLWSAGFSTGVTRRATLLPHGAQLTDTDPVADDVRGIGAYLYEPDGAVIRAGLVQQAAAVIGGWRIDEHLAYLSCDAEVATPLARGYRVLDVLPYSVKRLKAELRRRQVGIVEIKKRGVDIDPALLRHELKPVGPNTLTVLLARVGRERLAILADRL